jgi:hypothetical protein
MAILRGSGKADGFAHATQPRPRPIDIALVIIGSTVLVGLFMRPAELWLWHAALGFVAGCALGVIAWQWPRVAGPGLLVLSILSMAYNLVLALYILGIPPAGLLGLWGSTALLVGAMGVLRRRSAAQRATRHFVVQAGLVGSLGAAFLLYFVLSWPLQGKAILLNLPIMEQAVEPRVSALAGGSWAADWTTPRVTLPEALETVKRSLESDGWTIVDSSLWGEGVPLISAQRGAYSLLVIYDRVTYDPDFRRVDASADASMSAYVRRAPARLIEEPDVRRAPARLIDEPDVRTAPAQLVAEPDSNP